MRPGAGVNVSPISKPNGASFRITLPSMVACEGQVFDGRRMKDAVDRYGLRRHRFAGGPLALTVPRGCLGFDVSRSPASYGRTFSPQPQTKRIMTIRKAPHGPKSEPMKDCSSASNGSAEFCAVRRHGSFEDREWPHVG